MNSAWAHNTAIAAAPDLQLAEHANKLRALAHALGEISSAPWVSSDSAAHAILREIAQSRTPVDVDAHMDRLMIRIGQLIAERTGDNSELHRLAALTGPRARLRLFSHAHVTIETDAHGSSVRPRAFMKL